MLSAVVLFAVVAQLSSGQPTNYESYSCEENSVRTLEVLSQWKAEVNRCQENSAHILEILSQLKAEVAELKRIGNRPTWTTTKPKEKHEACPNRSASPADPPKVVCPAHFKYISAVNGCYKVVLSNLEWSVAGLRCRSLHKDAHLVFINSANEQRYITAMLSAYSDSATAHCRRWNPDPGVVYWTGGQRVDQSRDSSFAWKSTAADGATGDVFEMTYTNWAPRMPAGGAAESCMCMAKDSTFAWDDWACSEAACSVCELDM